MENRQRQAVEGLYRYIFCHESALRTQGVHPYQVRYFYCSNGIVINHCKQVSWKQDP